jgi:hypothetical protein
MTENPQSNARTALSLAGFPLDQLPESQLAVLDDLTKTEIDLLLALKRRLDDAGPDVVAHAESAGGIVW